MDAVLRQTLKSDAGVSREAARIVAHRVFSFHRWQGWLDPSVPLRDRIARAVDLADRFQQNPASVPDTELHRAVPAWIQNHVAVSPDWLRALQGEPTLWLRARPHQAAALATELVDADTPCAGAPDAVRYLGTRDLFRTAPFQAGRFEVQDVASQLVTVVANPQPGERWWDACAGEGGKTLHLADLMGNRGVVWATDRAEWRLKRLRLRAGRAGLFNIRWAAWDGGDRRPMSLRFDGVLVDAPCSAVGTWQRNPDARWSITPGDIAELAERQLALLNAAGRAVEPGGRLVYSVCTLTREETAGVAISFARENPEFEPMPVPAAFGPPDRQGGNPEAWLWPQVWNGNGMYVATWRRSRPGPAKSFSSAS